MSSIKEQIREAEERKKSGRRKSSTQVPSPQEAVSVDQEEVLAPPVSPPVKEKELSAPPGAPPAEQEEVPATQCPPQVGQDTAEEQCHVLVHKTPPPPPSKRKIGLANDNKA